jgi:hypothetical protein
MKNPIRPEKVILTFIVRDISPLLFLNDLPVKRTIQLELTEEQLKKLNLRWVGFDGGKDVYESLAEVFMENIEMKFTEVNK